LEKPSKWPEFLDDAVTIKNVEKLFAENFEECSGYRFIFNFDQDEIKHIFDGDVELCYEEDDNEHFVPTIFLGMKPQGTKKEKSAKPSKETEFIRDKTEQVKIFDSGKDDDKKILKMGNVGDLVVDINNTQDKLRGVASMVIDINDKGKLYLREAFDDSGYTDVPIEVTRRIEDPVEFYSLVPQFLEKPWGMRGLNLDAKVHAKIVAKLGKRVTVEKNGDVWYELDDVSEQEKNTTKEPKLKLIRWDTALDENVGLGQPKPIFNGKTQKEINKIIKEKWEDDEDFQEDFERSTLYFDNSLSVFITDEGKTKWRIGTPFGQKNK
jgi:hypothetical protein